MTPFSAMMLSALVTTGAPSTLMPEKSNQFTELKCYSNISGWKTSFHTPPVDHNLVGSAVQSGQHHISSTVFGVQSAQEISALGHVT
jgi:hypothetical protein